MIDKLDVTVIFPMAGRGVRFGYKFKPFLQVGNTTFIKRAVEGFNKCFDQVKEVIFIFLEEQEREYNVSQKLSEMFPLLNYRTVILENPTNGPAETVRNAIKKDGKISGRVMICDCDHYVDVKPVFDYLKEGKQDDCILPLWNLRGEDIKSWSVAALSDDGYIGSIAEKELPKSPGSFFGVIGCYYFNDVGYLGQENHIYISEIIQNLIQSKKKVKGIRVFNAEFFGDPKRLQNVLDTRAKKKGTIFCDLDGTIIKHEDVPSYDHPLEILGNSAEKLRKWRNEGYTIVFSSARKSEDEQKLINSLKEANIEYDQLIMGLPPGPRYLINDRKPSAILTPLSVAFEVERNKGIDHLEIESIKPNVLKMFKGGSLSKTLLVEKAGTLFVRKVISKDKEMAYKCAKLKKQCGDLKRLYKLCKDIVPAVYGEEENSFEYYYDIEFLLDHDLLSNYSNAEKLKATKLLLNKMASKVYKPGAHISESGSDWIKAHFLEKIYPKLKESELPQKLYSLITSDTVMIDGKPYNGLKILLQKISESPYVDFVKPEYLCPIHGDLTFENILYKNSSYNLSTNTYEPSVKIVDTDSIEFIDPPELDLGKIFQSVVSQYEKWSLSKENLVRFEEDNGVYLNFEPDKELLNNLEGYIEAWSQVINGDKKDIEIKGYFYMALHLIRMIPFRMAFGEDQAAYALVSAIKALDHSLELIKQKIESKKIIS